VHIGRSPSARQALLLRGDDPNSHPAIKYSPSFNLKSHSACHDISVGTTSLTNTPSLPLDPSFDITLTAEYSTLLIPPTLPRSLPGLHATAPEFRLYKV
jgi:hypothetical protein